jgi:hypothetical protein
MRAIESICRDIILPLINAWCVSPSRPQILHNAVLSIRLPYHHIAVCHSGSEADREVVTLRNSHQEPCMCLVDHVGLEEVQPIEFLLELSIYLPKT